MTDSPTPPALTNAIADLWRLTPPGPDNLFTAPTFKQLCETCEQLYPPVRSPDALGIALHNALRALGLPCSLPPGKQGLGLAADDAANRLDQAFRKTSTSRVHLCPLDCADELPSLAFGQATVRMFSASELAVLIDLPRLQRSHPMWKFDGDRLASFTWLVVKEEAALDGEPGKRAVPFFYTSIDEDLGAIEPHQQPFPPAVEAALFTLLLAPWEDWVEYTEMDWRAFRAPWVYTIDDDIFPAHPVPPLADTLGWEPCIYTDSYGEPVEAERPVCLPISDRAKDAPSWISQQSWATVESARRALLFGNPIAHFLIRAFVSRGIDEFLAHISVIEAGLGTRVDHHARERQKIRGANPGATKRVATRLSTLLGESASADDYLRLFDSRSAFLHGRTLDAIPSSDRVLARKLARRAAAELVKAAASEPTLPRETFLQRLLDG